MFKPSSNLINVHLKMYAKIIAVRLQSVIPSIISLDRVGLVPTWETRDSTIKLLSLISYHQSQKVPLCLLSLDAEKAFDRLDILESDIGTNRLTPGNNSNCYGPVFLPISSC